MDVKELILINSDKVRRDSNLMAFYIDAFQQAFNYKPACSSCSFNSDWIKLIKFVNKGEKIVNLQQTQNVMSTFKLKKTTNTILAYRLNGVTYRKYDNLLNEDFAVNYLTYGTEQEIEDRKKLFAILPNALTEVKKVDEKIVKTRKKRTPKAK